jgi:nucleoside-diphosphate-sugar epimerase/intein/homing endonuclease
MVENKKILITGGAGFIGSYIVDLLKGKNEVVVLDNLSAGREENIAGVKLIKKNVENIGKKDVQGFDAIVHCSAQVSTFLSVDYPSKDFKSNCLGTFKLFEACRKWNDNALIIYTSSRSVLGEIPEPKIADESFPYNPSTFYNVHKIYGELLTKIYSELYGMKFITLRPSNVYGPRQPYWMRGLYNFCLPEDAFISANPAPKPIKSIKVGDFVLTHKGRYRPVTQVFKRHYNGELICIKTRYYWEPLKVTPEHPVLAIQSSRIFTDHWKRVGIDLSKPRWIMAKDIKEADILLYPRPKFIRKHVQTYLTLSDYLDIYTKDGKIYGYTKNQYVEKCKGAEYNIPLKIPLNNAFMRIAALYLSEGCIATNDKQICFILSEEEQDMIERLRRDIFNVFGLKAKIEKRPKHHAVNVYVNSVVLARLFKRLFGKGAANKRIPEFFFELSKDKLKLLIDWMVKGDGYVNLSNRSYIRYASVSRTLIYQLRDILLSMGIFPSIEFKRGKRNVFVATQLADTQDIYFLAWYNHPIYRSRWITKDYVFLPIQKIERVHFDGFVYNLEVKDDHSYVAGYHTVHNCAYWIMLALLNKPIPIYGTGEQIRDYTYVEDVADAYVLALDNEKAIGETFLLAYGKGYNLNELADLIIKLTGSSSKKEYLPPRKGDIKRFVGSHEKAEKILGWVPKTSLEEGLKKEIEWCKQELKERPEFVQKAIS